MRGRPEEQTSTFMLMTLESRVAADHPERRFKALAGAGLEELSPLFDEVYGETGRPSVPPERLLQATCRWRSFTENQRRPHAQLFPRGPSDCGSRRPADRVAG